MRSGNPHFARRHDGGFSLTEMLVVLFILALMTVAAGYSLRSRDVPLDHLAHELAASAREARSLAVMSGTDAVLLVDVAAKRHWIADRRRGRDMPASISIELTVADVERASETLGGIRFFPDGSSTGGQVRISRGEASATVSIDWMTGRAAAVRNRQ